MGDTNEGEGRIVVSGERNVVIDGNVTGGVFALGDHAHLAPSAPPSQAEPFQAEPDPEALALFGALSQRFTLDDLLTLCFDLGVNADDLPGETLRAKARELVRLYQRRGRLAVLRAGVEQALAE
ncbi:MAG: hypothetical protein KIT87_28500 [Anaerolineae bacterium]|nr:hypothetical protein [Anaerolineae bacterium]